jgi:hypothetical protein
MLRRFTDVMRATASYDRFGSGNNLNFLVSGVSAGASVEFDSLARFQSDSKTSRLTFSGRNVRRNVRGLRPIDRICASGFWFRRPTVIARSAPPNALVHCDGHRVGIEYNSSDGEGVGLMKNKNKLKRTDKHKPRPIVIYVKVATGITAELTLRGEVFQFTSRGESALGLSFPLFEIRRALHLLMRGLRCNHMKYEDAVRMSHGVADFRLET